jgi:probable HAF family extracellular repeat protein
MRTIGGSRDAITACSTQTLWPRSNRVLLHIHPLRETTATSETTGRARSAIREFERRSEIFDPRITQVWSSVASATHREIIMKSKKLMRVVTFAALAVSLPMAAQEEHAKHHHYKLVDLGTFGGPLNYINGDDLLVPYMEAAQSTNGAGTLIGWADTSTLDPYNPFCFNGDCYVSHAFEWHNGFKSDLGVLPGGQNSATSWISANGLIVGASQNGELDPLSPGFPENHAVLWRDGNIIDLGTLPEGGYESDAEAVNSRGQVVGWAFNTVPDPYSMGDWSPLYNYYEPTPPYSYQNRAFLWENGVVRDLGTLGTGTDAYAVAINERGQVIGISYTSSTPNPIITACSSGGAAGGSIPLGER